MIRYSEGNQTGAGTKGLITNRHHVGRDGDRSQARTIIVFINCYISAICVLNGRKVMRKNLRSVEKNKI